MTNSKKKMITLEKCWFASTVKEKNSKTIKSTLISMKCFEMNATIYRMKNSNYFANALNHLKHGDTIKFPETAGTINPLKRMKKSNLIVFFLCRKFSRHISCDFFSSLYSYQFQIFADNKMISFFRILFRFLFPLHLLFSSQIIIMPAGYQDIVTSFI